MLCTFITGHYVSLSLLNTSFSNRIIFFRASVIIISGWVSQHIHPIAIVINIVNSRKTFSYLSTISDGKRYNSDIFPLENLIPHLLELHSHYYRTYSTSSLPFLCHHIPSVLVPTPKYRSKSIKCNTTHPHHHSHPVPWSLDSFKAHRSYLIRKFLNLIVFKVGSVCTLPTH